jgi:hypothetical protein
MVRADEPRTSVFTKQELAEGLQVGSRWLKGNEAPVDPSRGLHLPNMLRWLEWKDNRALETVEAEQARLAGEAAAATREKARKEEEKRQKVEHKRQTQEEKRQQQEEQQRENAGEKRQKRQQPQAPMSAKPETPAQQRNRIFTLHPVGSTLQVKDLTLNRFLHARVDEQDKKKPRFK